MQEAAVLYHKTEGWYLFRKKETRYWLILKPATRTGLLLREVCFIKRIAQEVVQTIILKLLLPEAVIKLNLTMRLTARILLSKIPVEMKFIWILRVRILPLLHLRQ